MRQRGDLGIKGGIGARSSQLAFHSIRENMHLSNTAWADTLQMTDGPIVVFLIE
jgi:hypothetical protein